MRFAILTVFLLLSTLTAEAGCYTNNMSTYQGVASDGTNLSVTAVADGTYAMCQIPPGYPPNYIHHTTYSQVTLKSNNTGVTKTGAGSTTACPTCYVSVQSNSSLPMGSDDNWDFSWYDSVNCSIAGTVFSLVGSLHTHITTTYGWKRSQYKVSAGCGCNDYYVGTYSPQCTNGNINASCPVTVKNDPLGATWDVPYTQQPGQTPYQNVITKFINFQLGGNQCIQLTGYFTQPQQAPSNGGTCN